MPDFLSVKDVAAYLGVEYKTAWRLVTSGEVPAARVGKLYRIERQDLQAYLASSKKTMAGAAPDTLVDTLLCGNCGRVIPTPEMSGGMCSAPSCEEWLCSTCWSQVVRTCHSHRPTGSERIGQAQAALARGEVDRAVTAIQARQRELTFLTRFDERVIGIAAIQNPLNGEVVQVNDWLPFHSTVDDSAHLLDLLGVAFLERSQLAVTPINAGSRFRIPAGALGRNRPKQGLTLEAQVLSDMAAQARQKVITVPESLATLMVQLQDRQLDAEQNDELHVVGLAATSGWDRPSVDYVSASAKGQSYRHRLLLPVLVDLHTGQLHFDTTDQRLKGFVGLFNPAREAEEMLRVEQWIEARIQAEHRSGLMVQEIVDQLGLSPGFVQRVCVKMAANGRYRYVPDKDTGGMVIVNR